MFLAIFIYKTNPSVNKDFNFVITIYCILFLRCYPSRILCSILNRKDNSGHLSYFLILEENIHISTRSETLDIWWLLLFFLYVFNSFLIYSIMTAVSPFCPPSQSLFSTYPLSQNHPHNLLSEKSRPSREIIQTPHSKPQ